MNHKHYSCQARLKRKGRKGPVPCCYCKAHKSCKVLRVGNSTISFTGPLTEPSVRVVYSEPYGLGTPDVGLARTVGKETKLSWWQRLKSWFKSFKNGRR